MNKLREALESAIEVTESLAKQLDSDELWTHLAMLKETLATEPESAGEPLVYGLPEGTTHISKLKANVCKGGIITIRANAFKYVDNELMVYKTDADNEYPEWVKAKKVFFNLNFEVTNLYPHPSPEAVRKLPRLTDDDLKKEIENIRLHEDWDIHGDCDSNWELFANTIMDAMEAKAALAEVRTMG